MCLSCVGRDIDRAGAVRAACWRKMSVSAAGCTVVVAWNVLVAVDAGQGVWVP